jgi:hypothetical protein
MTVATDERSADRLLSGRAWDDLCEVLKQAGGVIDQFGDDINDLDRTEWYRFLSRLVRHGFQRYVENSEPARPRLLNTPWRQAINFQSPDQDHLIAEFFDGAFDYRITGNRGTIPYFIMAAWEGDFPADPGSREWASEGVKGLAEFDPAVMRTTAFLTSDQIRFDAEGDFSVIASREQPADGSDWLPVSGESVGILVRTLYHLREETLAPSLRIERLDGTQPRPLRAGELGNGLARAGQIVLGYAELVRRWWQERPESSPNRIVFDLAVYLANGGVADRHHGFGTWECGVDEALVVQFTPTPCDYWILQLCNIWQENLDNYEDGNGYLQKYRAAFEPDGSIRVVVAHQDPKLGGNWIDPFGHVHGGWSLRLIKAAGGPPEISVHRLPLSLLKQHGFSALAGLDAVHTGGLTT